jgi:hypothetical protein
VAGNQNVFNCDGITICVHYVHTTKAALGNDNCSEDTMPAKLMKADEIARKEKIATDSDRQTIARTWSPTIALHTLKREKYKEKSGVNFQKQESDKRCRQLQMHDTPSRAYNPETPASLKL